MGLGPQPRWLGREGRRRWRHSGAGGAAPSVETSDVCDTSDVVYYLDGGTIFPPLARQFSFVVFVCPWPLQPFFPAQAWPLPWHDPEPLHELMPSQTTSSPALAVDMPTAPDANIPATAVA